ncbi:hypothetical protein AB1Y20_009751 [Prymnesium parvum]|uniref:Uncharacterized protein n=1 Tax=Prymnesium parvum TaxID=97485 RepID=A0AB34K598_PRYPA
MARSEEREPITEEAGTKRTSIARDGAAPCMALTALLLGVAVVGSVALALAIAAFDPEVRPNATALPPPPPLAAAAEAHRSLRPRAAAEAWAFRGEAAGGEVWRVRSDRTWAEAVEALANGSLGALLGEQLRRSPHAAFYWETPPLTLAAAAATPFQFVTVRAPDLLARAPTLAPFAAALAGCTAGARAFANLRGDALLVAPCPPADGREPASHAHLAAFVRSAPVEAQLPLWREVGRALQRELRARGDAPTWVSTEGTGVSWLHVRLDSSPKYFHHLPYRRPVSRRLGIS